MAGNKTVDELVSKAVKQFEIIFKQKPSYASCAPGRVNLIGEHTDYNDGFVFPMVRYGYQSRVFFCNLQLMQNFSEISQQIICKLCYP